MREIDIFTSTAMSTIHFMLNTTLWDSFDTNVLGIISSPQSWNEVKMLAPNGKKNPQLNTIPNDRGGIYLLIIKSGILSESHIYLMYIGRAHRTATHNLRKRCSRYPREKKRPKIKRLIEQWGQYLYIRYLPLDDDATIDAVERELVKKIQPPCNDDIPDKEIRDAVKAFTM